MDIVTIKTAAWFTKLPEDHARIGISRGTPRRQAAGYRIFRALSPGPWFNSVPAEEYVHRYRTEILDPLNPLAVAAELAALAPGRIPTLLCFEMARQKQWCHRALAAAWLAEATGQSVPEFGFEELAQRDHPLGPPGIDYCVSPVPAADGTPFNGLSFERNVDLRRHEAGQTPARPRHSQRRRSHLPTDANTLA